MTHRIRPLDPSSDPEVELVATRMRATLVEVLGEERGASLYTMDWLRDRVRWHLDPARTARVFLAVAPDHHVSGHTIVRVEVEDPGQPCGLFSTIYVEPASRRQGVASALLERGEAWLRSQGVLRAATHTAADNQRLVGLLEARGYRIVLEQDDMVRLSRRLRATGTA